MIMGMLASLQDLFVPLGFASKEALEMSKSIAKLSIDLASFNNLPTAEAAAALQSALVGNHETVRRFGVILSEATVKEEIFRLGLAKTKAEVTDQMKVQARLSIIIAKTKAAEDDAIRTKNSFANQMRALAAVTEQAAREFGNVLVPTLQSVIATTKAVIGWFKGLSSETKGYIVVLGLLTAALGPVILAMGTLLKLQVGLALAGYAQGAALLGGALSVVGVAAAAAGTALAGFMIGKWVADWIGLSGAIKDAANAMDLFGGKTASAEIDATVAATKRLREENTRLLSDRLKATGIDRAELRRRIEGGWQDIYAKGIAAVAEAEAERARALKTQDEDAIKRVDKLIKKLKDAVSVTDVANLWAKAMAKITGADKPKPTPAAMPPGFAKVWETATRPVDVPAAGKQAAPFDPAFSGLPVDPGAGRRQQDAVAAAFALGIGPGPTAPRAAMAPAGRDSGGPTGGDGWAQKQFETLGKVAEILARIEARDTFAREPTSAPLPA